MRTSGHSAAFALAWFPYTREHMERDDRPPSRLPAQPAPRSLTTTELEAVIRRAIELQASHPTRGDDGVSEADVVRIGQELGLEPAAVRRAMAEVRGRPPEERGALDGFVGAAIVRASRVVQRPALEVAKVLDRHLRDVELMVPQRRFGDRTVYVRDSSISAGLARFTRGFARAQQPLNLKQLDVAVSAIDAGSCLVEASVNLNAVRGGLFAGVFGSSGVLATGWATAVWATAVADPLMLLGLPVLLGGWAGTRAIYSQITRNNRDRLELLLDRLEHNSI
jgi:hypothetical protein